MAQIFISHSQADTSIRALFERAFATSNVRAVFVEYEGYSPPPGPYIQAEINSSVALFLLQGPNVERLSHTKVWIASEVGIAQQASKDIWVFEPIDQPCNVPVPFVTHYVPYAGSEQAFQYLRSVIKSYDDSAALGAVVRGGAFGVAGGALLGDEGKKGEAAAIGALAGAVFEAWRTNPSRSRPMGTPVECAYPMCRVTYRIHGIPPSFLCPVCRRPLAVNWGQLPEPQT